MPNADLYVVKSRAVLQLPKSENLSADKRHTRPGVSHNAQRFDKRKHTMWARIILHRNYFTELLCSENNLYSI